MPRGSQRAPVPYNAATVDAPNEPSEYADQRDEDVLWSEISPSDEPLRHRWFLPAIVGILALSIPWYLPDTIGNRLIGGLPLWTWITVVCTFLLACATSFASLRLWRNKADASRGQSPPT